MEQHPGLRKILEQLAGARILVVGDLMVDCYVWGEVSRISPEAPVAIVKVGREERRLGGAANVAHNLTALGCRVGVCGLTGEDANGQTLQEMLAELGADVGGLIADPTRPTTEKTRVMAQHQQLLRLDREETHPISAKTAGRMEQFLAAAVGGYSGVIVSDYGKGLVTPALMGVLRKACRTAGVELVVDPKGRDYGKYRGVGCITPNEREAGVAAGHAMESEAGILEAGRKLMAELELPRICVTRGAQGVLAMEGKTHRLLPALAREVFDVSGAGDTFISVFGAALFSGTPFFEAVAAANLAAGVAVGKVGTATVSSPEILAAAQLPGRAHTAEEIEQVAASLRARGKRIVFTNGCFDLLHAGHVQYLQASRNLGDVLVVGINSDTSVKRLKGAGRPVIGEDDRAHLLAALGCVDYVVVFGEDDPRELIRRVRPHVLTKGEDYTVETVVGHDLVPEWGGEVRLIPLAENRSTSGLIEKISNSAKRTGTKK